MLQYNPSITGSLKITGSLLVTGDITALGGITISGSVASASYALSASEASTLQGLGSASFAPAATFNIVSQSFATTSGSLSTRVTSLESASSSFAAQSASLSTRLTTDESNYTSLSSSFATTSGSAASRLNVIETSYATTGSNNFTAPQQISDVSNAISFTSTASLYTEGGLRVKGSSFISGTAYFNDVVVYGTSSIEYITSSQIAIGTNLITLNTDTPSVRYGGISVFDSGSNNLSTGSLFWDSEKDKWIYSNPSGSTYDGGMLISGPRNSSGLGNEVGTTSCALMMGQGGDHITSSAIFSYGNATCFYGNSRIESTGAACFANNLITYGCLGVNTNGPQKLIHVATNVENGIYISCNSAELVIGNNHTFASKTCSTTIALAGGNTDFFPTSIAGDSIIATQCGNLLFGTGMNAGVASGTERMRISNAGNIGIACTAPGFTLDINGTLNICTSTGSQIRFISYGGSSAKMRGTQATLGIEACGALTLETNGANERLRIESSGIACFSCTVCVPSLIARNSNITINPSTYNWYSISDNSFKVLDFGKFGSVYSYQDGACYSGFANNAYFANSTFDWRYKNTTGASNLLFQNGAMFLETAGSGTADTPIPLTTKLQVSACGQLTMYSKTDPGALTVVSAAPSSQCFLTFYDNGQNGNCIVASMVDANGANAAGGLAFTVWRKSNAAGMRLISNNIIDNTATGSEPVMNLSSYSYCDAAMTIKTPSVGFNHMAYGFSYNDTELVKIRASGTLVLASGIGGASNARLIAYCGGNGNANGLGLDMGGCSYEYSNFFGYGTSDNGRMTFGSWNSNTYYQKMIILGNGNIGVPGNATAIYNASDCRLKENVNVISDGIGKIMCLNPVSFNWKESFIGSEQHCKTNLGFLAQEVQTAIPEAVEAFGGSDIHLEEGTVCNPLRVNEKFLLAVAVKAIQEQQCTINTLKACLGIA